MTYWDGVDDTAPPRFSWTPDPASGIVQRFVGLNYGWRGQMS